MNPQEYKMCFNQIKFVLKSTDRIVFILHFEYGYTEKELGYILGEDETVISDMINNICLAIKRVVSDDEKFLEKSFLN